MKSNITTKVGKNKLKEIFKKQGFTLVELIIVIAIIAVLAVSAFMIVTKWISHSRDSRRLADLDTIHKSLEIWIVDLDNTSYVVPIPDNYREVSLDGTIWYQGIVGTGVTEIVHSLVKKPIDPNGQDYVYSIMKKNQRIYQVATVLENDTAMLINGVLAIDGTNIVEGSFEPALYETNLDDGSCGVVYLPSIVVAPGIESIDPDDGQQYFVLDGESNNLLYGGTTMRNYSDIVNVANDIDIVWSGTCDTDLSTTSVINTIVTNLDGMIPLADGDTVDSSLVETLLTKGGTSGITTTQTPVPNTPADGVSVSADSDNNTGEFQGSVTIEPATDESNITHYVIYWATIGGTKIGSTITTIAKGDDPIVYNIPADTSFPVGATKILVVTKNSSGEMSSGVVDSFVDNVSGGGGGSNHDFTTSFLDDDFWTDFDINDDNDKDNLKEIFATDSLYTQNWDTYTECNITNVVEINDILSLNTLSANTIYVLNFATGNKTLGGKIDVGGNCIGLVSKNSGGTRLTNSIGGGVYGDGFIDIDGKNSIIIDNIEIMGHKNCGSCYSINGIKINNSGKNITMNNIISTNNEGDGFLIRNQSKFVTITNSEISLNKDTGIDIDNLAQYININNSKNYSNSYGMRIEVGVGYEHLGADYLKGYLTVNNAQIYSNSTQDIFSNSTTEYLETNVRHHPTSIPNQVQPLRYNSSNVTESYGSDGVEYDTTKLIGEW